MGPVTLTLGWLACGVLVATLVGRRRRRDYRDVLAAWALCMVWLVGAMAREALGVLDLDGVSAYLFLGPATDVALLVWWVAQQRHRPTRWGYVLATLIALQLILHATYGLSDRSGEATYLYKLALNVSFIAQLLCPLTPGGLYGFRRVLDRMSHRRRASDRGVA